MEKFNMIVGYLSPSVLLYTIGIILFVARVKTVEINDEELYWLDIVFREAIIKMMKLSNDLFSWAPDLLNHLKEFIERRIDERDALLGVITDFSRYKTFWSGVLSTIIAYLTTGVSIAIALSLVTFYLYVIYSSYNTAHTLVGDGLPDKSGIHTRVLRECIRNCLINNIDGVVSKEDFSGIYDNCVYECIMGIVVNMNFHKSVFQVRGFSTDTETDSSNVKGVVEIKYFSVEDLVNSGLFSYKKEDSKMPRVDEDDLTYELYNSIEKELRFRLEVDDSRFYVMYKYNLDHPHHKFQNYKQILKLININKNLARWYKSTKDEFATFKQAPSWLQNSYSDLSNWRSEYMEMHMNFKKTLETFRVEKQIIDTETIKKKNEIDIKQEKYIQNNVGVLYPILIDKITVGSLDYEVTQRIIAESEGDDIEKKLYEELSKYKLSLLNRYKNKEISKEELIEILKEALASN